MVVTIDTIICEVVRENIMSGTVLMQYGIKPLPSVMGESVGDVALINGIDPEELVDKLNAFLAEN